MTLSAQAPVGQGYSSRVPMPRATGYGRLPLVALAATLALSAGENGSLSQAVNGIKHAFGVSDALVALLPFAMSVVGVLGAVPFGIMADRRRRTLILAGAMLAWTACMGLNGLAWSFLALLGFRLGVGFAEASSSASISLMADYYPVSQRAARMGLYQLGSIVGTLIGFIGGGVAVSLGGWRWAFWFWVPLSLGTVALLLRQPEPRRGEQEVDFEADRAAASADRAASAERAAASGGAPVANFSAYLLIPELPAPRRIGTADYRAITPRQVLNELLRIPSMWWALLSLTVAQGIANALGFWAIPFFERFDHMSPTTAGLYAGLLLPCSVAGVLGGGFLSDRLMRRGVLHGRIYVVVAGAVLSSVALPVGFATHNMVLTATMLMLGGFGITLPIAPSEALFNDVVVAELRGRAASVRSIVRAASTVGALVVGIMADHLGGKGGAGVGLEHALMIFAPVCGVGGIFFIFARRSYGHDFAFATSETVRMQALLSTAAKRVEL